MNEYEMLNQIKQTHPIVAGERTTWLSPLNLVETFNISMEMAEKVAMEYNAEISSLSQKHR